ncbi:MAG: hypothetical protein HZA23_03175 [Nitrospirae bacterium]|nr:hypothetical protein [Nitrospirota bacterium]
MRPPIIAGLLSGLLWPGAGQFYNKQHRKGAAITAAVLALLGYFLWRLARIFFLVLPPGLSGVEGWVEAQRIRFLALHDPLLHWSLYLLVAVWVYAMIDAVWVAARRASARK